MEAGLAGEAGAADARVKRMRWRCRRGTRELDVLLGDWLDRHAAGADASEMDAFAALLERQDPELWHWLLGDGQPARPDWRAIVDDIRSHAGVAR